MVIHRYRPSALFASVRAGCDEIDGARKHDDQQPADADGLIAK